MTSAHTFMAVERALTDSERNTLMSRVMHSPLRHTSPADVLDNLDSVDALLEYTEPWWEEHATKITRDEWELYRVCVLALAAVHLRTPSFQQATELVLRANSNT